MAVAAGQRRRAGTDKPKSARVVPAPTLSESGPHASRPPMLASAISEGNPAAASIAVSPAADAPKISKIMNLPPIKKGSPVAETPVNPSASK
eukprot:scaffold93796_cov31-Tisochrysis_lutea.AAC.2